VAILYVPPYKTSDLCPGALHGNADMPKVTVFLDLGGLLGLQGAQFVGLAALAWYGVVWIGVRR
jgi:hypothetical protein